MQPRNEFNKPPSLTYRRSFRKTLHKRHRLAHETTAWHSISSQSTFHSLKPPRTGANHRPLYQKSSHGIKLRTSRPKLQHGLGKITRQVDQLDLFNLSCSHEPFEIYESYTDPLHRKMRINTYIEHLSVQFMLLHWKRLISITEMI